MNELLPQLIHSLFNAPFSFPTTSSLSDRHSSVLSCFSLQIKCTTLLNFFLFFPFLTTGSQYYHLNLYSLNPTAQIAKTFLVFLSLTFDLVQV